MIATLDTPSAAPVTRAKRAPQDVTCPACGSRQATAATTVRCNDCGLRAPVSAFAGQAQTRKYGQPRAFTIRGNID